MKARKHLLTHVFMSLAALPVAMPPAFAANAPAVGQLAQNQGAARGPNVPASGMNFVSRGLLVAQAEEPKPEPPPGDENQPERKKKHEEPGQKPAEPPKAEAPKPEPPKPEPPKPEPPKAEAPKPAAPAEEPAKPEPPKPEPPKAEAPKPEAPKAEAPAPEAPKPEKKRAVEPDAEAKPPAEKPAAPAPKPAAEAPKPAAEPKPAEKPAPEAPKPAAEAPKPAGEPKPSEVKPEPPKADAPKAPADAAPEPKRGPGAERPPKPGDAAKPTPPGDAPAPAAKTMEAPAAAAPDGQQAPVLDSAKPAPVLDSAKPAPGTAPAGQPNAARSIAPDQPPAPPAPGQQPAAVAPAPAGQSGPAGDRRRPPPPPKSDADAQAPLGNAPPPPPLAPTAGGDRGQRMQGRPRYDAPSDAQVEGRVDGRDVLNILGQMIVRGGDSDRFSRGGGDVYYDRLPGDRTRETIERPNGVTVVTIRNRYGDVIQRSRIGRDGRETVLFYDPDLQRRPDRETVFRDPSLDLPPMQLDIPVDEYIIDTSSARNPDYYDFLREPPVERVERVYSLDEVRYSARIRDKMRRVDLDTIHFATGSADVSMNEATSLKQIAVAMKKIIDKNPAETFLIEGHTDAVGSDQSNLVLSDRRAESVAIALTDLYDIPAENLVTQGYGERFLKVRTSGPSAENRRVTIRRITPLVRPVASR